jgi:hypothetical protein
VSARLTALRERPIADSERRLALVAVATLLLAATAALIITRPSSRHPARRADPRALVALPAADPPKPPKDPLSRRTLAPAAARVAREFLVGYLAYLYGHAPAAHVGSATASLLRSLQTHPPRVSPAMRRRRPHVVSLSVAAAAGGRFSATALIGDGGVADYRVGLLLIERRGRLLVGGLEGER